MMILPVIHLGFLFIGYFGVIVFVYWLLLLFILQTCRALCIRFWKALAHVRWGGCVAESFWVRATIGRLDRRTRPSFWAQRQREHVLCHFWHVVHIPLHLRHSAVNNLCHSDLLHSPHCSTLTWTLTFSMFPPPPLLTLQMEALDKLVYIFYLYEH